MILLYQSKKIIFGKDGKDMKKPIIYKIAQALAALSLFAGLSSLTQTCWLNFYQPKMPERIRDYK